MLPSLKLIKQMRIKLGITQKALSDMVGISKSMMNQIETGRFSTGYDTAKKIFDCLATMESKSSQRTVYELCSKKIVSIKPTDTINHAIKIMQKSSISQIPVFDKLVVVGLISEDQIMSHLSEDKKIKNIKVAEIMIEPPPVVSHLTPVQVLAPLMRFSKCLLISKSGVISGIITASDTLRLLE
ncbi:MAG: CBS domain-containing protein [Candidatus Nitrosoabyssus spongiisocia]|nr:MAG: CBS domain-containing protein [Nitrosopumilaceae archaeon AB1(1)]